MANNLHMNGRQLEVEKAKLKDERQVLKELKETYNKASKDIANNIRIQQGRINVLLKNIDKLSDEEKSILQAATYQKQFQERLKKQIDGYIDTLNSAQHGTMDKYLKQCYDTGFIGSIYDMHGQGVPIIAPINQKQVARATALTPKLSRKMYGTYAGDVKQAVRREISRGIATADSFAHIARNVNSATNMGFNRMMRIVRTEGHRIQSMSAFDAQHAAKDAGADIVKQWNAALDGKTRDTHRQLDGQIRELDEPFEVGGMTAMYPSDFGDPAEDINCRCALQQRARWALDEDELQRLKNRAEFYGLDKSKSFADFENKYMQAAKAEKAAEKKAAAAKTKNAISFTPAKTIEEAEEYVKQFVDDSQFGAVGVSLKGIDLEVANAVNETLTKLFNDYNIGKMGGVIAPSGNTKLGKLIANAKAAYSPVRKSLLLNKKTFKNLKTLAKEIEEEKRLIAEYIKDPKAFVFSNKRAEAIAKASVVSGRATVPETVEDIINHEFGHTFENAISKMDNFDRIKANMSIYAPKISGYATTEMGEYIAESFASYRKGEKLIDPELAKAFKKLEKTGVKEINSTGKKSINTLDEIGKTGIMLPKRQFGRKAGKHAADYGLDVRKPADREKLSAIIADIIQNNDDSFVGNWRGQTEPVRFWIKGDDVVITKENSKEFVTIMKGGANKENVKKERR